MTGWIDLLETVYDLETPSHDAWLGRLVERCTSAFRPTGRAMGCIFWFDGNALQIFAPSSTDPDFASRAIAVTRDSPRYLQRCLHGAPYKTMSADCGRRRFLEWAAFRDNYAPLGIKDTVGLVARDGGPWGVSVAVGQPEIRTVSRREAAPWTRVAAHIHAALRLRFQLHGAPPLETAADALAFRTRIDAVVSPDGTLRHAEPEAQPFADSLRHAAVAIDRARGRMRREDPEGALEAWRALVAGEWSLVESFESDGRRYLLARLNRPDRPRTPRLTERERVVLGLRARSHGLKLIAYETGLSLASVSRTLASGMSKLGIRSAADLVVRDGKVD